MLLGCAALVAFDPLFKRFESAWTRRAFVAAGFIVWGVLLSDPLFEKACFQIKSAFYLARED
ncbi:MAG TPA: hypothetical protein VN673_06465 [Clostridia bacterium]|nr:hypothetical protein [Clostridia bacterium]